jgi:hypothetical protein
MMNGLEETKMAGGLYVGLFFFLATGAVALFTFVAVASWSEARKQERIALYRSELLKKLAEQPGDGARRVIDVLREEGTRRDVGRRRGLLLGGMVTMAVGLGLMVLLGSIRESEINLMAVGLIPFLIGTALVLFGWLGMRSGRREAEYAAATVASLGDSNPS